MSGISNQTLHNSTATGTNLLVWLFGTVFTQTVCGIGLLGNLFGSVMIFSRRLYRKAPIFIYFGYIAIIDLIHVVTVVLTETNLFYVITDSSTPRSAANLVICKVLWFLNWPTGDLSIIIVIAAHAYKLYCMLNPFDLVKRDTTRAVILSCVLLTIISVGLDSHLLWTTDITVTADSYVCQMGDNYPRIRQIVFMYLLIFICTICPVLLVILALAIALSFLRSYKAHKKLTQKDAPSNSALTSPSATYDAAKNSLFMLLPISLIQFIGTMPFGIVMYVSYSNESFDASAFYTVVTFFNHCNYAFNVILQFIASKFYRNALLGRL